MTAAASRPEGTILLSSYQELDRFVRAFADGQLNLLFLLGRPGVQKSQIVQAAVGPRAGWIDGSATAFGLYRQLYRHRDELVVLDDVDGLYRDRAAVRLPDRAHQAGGLAFRRGRLAPRGNPRSFETRSRLAIIANGLRTPNVNVRAVQDRGHIVLFEPSAVEVYLRAARWFWDQAVFDFIGGNLQLAEWLSMRDYTLGWELKQAGLDWQNCLLTKWRLSRTRRLVARLKADCSFQSEQQRVQAFIAQGGGCRRRTTIRPENYVPRPPYPKFGFNLLHPIWRQRPSVCSNCSGNASTNWGRINASRLRAQIRRRRLSQSVTFESLTGGRS